MKKFKCKICGYVKEGILENEFFCPKCGVDKSMFEEIIEDSARVPIEESNPSITRISNKCINCGMCLKTCKLQTGIEYDIKTHKPICINCGACRIACPTSALSQKYDYKDVDDLIKNTNKTVVVLTSPAVRVSLGEEFNLEPGSFVEGKMVSALKQLGFDYVFDTTFGADLTSVEEANELIERISKNENLPMFTSCCPAWVKYMEIYHPTKLNHLSTCKSPIAMECALIKNYFSKVINKEKDDIITVALTPCTAKKYEASREELDDLDYVITTSELALYLREENIDFVSLKDSKFDDMFSKGTSSGTIFGTSGGVMTSALRAAYYLLTKKDPEENFINFENLTSNENIKEATITINDKVINVAIINGLKNVFPILESIENGEKIKYDFIEVMNCTGGCIAGGGQPLTLLSKLDEIKEKRSNGLLNEDKNSNNKLSYKNKDIINIYENYLEGIGSTKSHLLLHTNYIDKSNLN